MDKSNAAFQELHLTLDRVTSDLHHEGLGVTKKSAAVILFEHENILWEKQLLSCSTPKALQMAVFYSVGVNFVLRGVQEYHSQHNSKIKITVLIFKIRSKWITVSYSVSIVGMTRV